MVLIVPIYWPRGDRLVEGRVGGERGDDRINAGAMLHVRRIDAPHVDSTATRRERVDVAVLALNGPTATAMTQVDSTSMRRKWDTPIRVRIGGRIAVAADLGGGMGSRSATRRRGRGVHDWCHGICLLVALEAGGSTRNEIGEKSYKRSADGWALHLFHGCSPFGLWGEYTCLLVPCLAQEVLETLVCLRGAAAMERHASDRIWVEIAAASFGAQWGCRRLG